MAHITTSVMSLVLASPRMLKNERTKRNMENMNHGNDIFHGKNAISAIVIPAIHAAIRRGADRWIRGNNPITKRSHDAIIWNNLLFIY